MEHSACRSWSDAYAGVQEILLLERKIRNACVYPHWIGDSGIFWYERTSVDGREVRIVDGSTGQGRVAFTLEAVAAALGAALVADVDPELVILAGLEVECELPRARFEAYGRSWSYDYASRALTETPKTRDRHWVVSADGRLAAFLRDYNLWVRDIEAGSEWALTMDGTETYAYADVPACLRVVRARTGARAEGLWSPDSRRFLTLQVDDRHVPPLPLVSFAPGDGSRPEVSLNRTSLPGDAKVTEFRLISLDVVTGRQVAAHYPRLSAVRMNDTPFSAGTAWWSPDSRIAYFVDVERGEKAAHVVAFDVETGETRVIFSERADTYVELGVSVYSPVAVVPLPATNEVLWYSERSGRGHLYLYDLGTGVLKHAVTSGVWQVRKVLGVDASRREVFLIASGIAPDEDPYICKPVIACLDGGATRVISSERGEHILWRPGDLALMHLSLVGCDPRRVSALSPDGKYFVETVGTVTQLPRTVLRRRDGQEVTVLERAEGLLPESWMWPEPVKLEAADGGTDIYGLLFKPYGYDPAQTYPVIDYIYGGPQTSSTPKIAFGEGGPRGSTFIEAAALAALGTFVVVMDGRGTAERERAFRQASYGAVHTASDLRDHIVGIRQLAERHPAMDLDRVGICGFSAGGYASVLAVLRFGGFFKVAVAGGGNYDQALFWHCWGERYQGPYDPELYKLQAARTYAKGLTGRLLLIHGLMDSGCHPAGLFQLVQALIEENKDVDLVVLPRAAHELTGYGTRRRLDYFVAHLFGSTPPPPVKLLLAADEVAQRIAVNVSAPAGADMPRQARSE
ncbi:MAG: DPP IV N-terminal domain-containing protein [Steroidobacteraceae bacterium]